MCCRDGVEMSASKKPKLELDVSNISDEHGKATVHGVITELSPIKQSVKNE